MNELPKVIHYCWFGEKQLSNEEYNCIQSWKRFCPDYEIKEWNETNFDINCCDYAKEAYQAKKWAFVSDYARFVILQRYGGVYFDTDVEVLKPIEELTSEGPFMGWEENEGINEGPFVAPGLGMAAYPNMPFISRIIDYYNGQHYINKDGLVNKETVVTINTKLLIEDGLQCDKSFQKIDDFCIYPPEVLCPMNKASGKINITGKTLTIHKYSMSWFNPYEKRIVQIMRKYAEKGKSGTIRENAALLPWKVKNKLFKKLHQSNNMD